MSKDFDYDKDQYDEELEYDEYEDLEVYDDIDDMEYDLDSDEEDDFDEYEEEDFREIILTLDDDSELRCLVIAQYDVDGTDYIALLPLEKDDTPGEVLLYRAKYDDDDEENFEVELIEDEDEFQLATDGYFDNIEFDVDEYFEMQREHHDHHCDDENCTHEHHHHHDHDHEEDLD